MFIFIIQSFSMKKIVTLLALVFCLNGKAQTWVTIPDANFAHYLDSIIPAAMSGNQMDVNSNLVTTSTHTINIYRKSISNLSGVQYFTSLTALYCSNNSLTTLPALPNTIIELDCGFNQLTSLPVLPNFLKSLGCTHNNLTSLPILPNTLNGLMCSDNLLVSLPSLPDSLIQLDCMLNSISNLPILPNSLTVRV